ncbi:hypothetical protein WA158_004316 [Blastocystis sp. Blastoise]
MESKKEKNILTYNNWTVMIEASKPIMPLAEVFAKEKEIKMKFPEMVFDQNTVDIKNDIYNFRLSFNALDYMKNRCKEGEIPQVTINTNKKWNLKLTVDSKDQEITTFSDGYDWTFLSLYGGKTECSKEYQPTEEKIDMNRLMRHEDILQYGSVILLEDDYHDNGIGQLVIKTRVMPSYIFVLSQYYCRIDEVIVRVVEHRYFIDTRDNYIKHEYKYMSAPWSAFPDSECYTEYFRNNLNKYSGSFKVEDYKLEEIRF